MTRKKRRLLGAFSGAALFLAFLYLYPVPSHAPISGAAPIVSTEVAKPEQKEITFSVLDEGEMAPGAKSRKNYAIYSQDELHSFWKLSHASDTSKEPVVDFKKQYVLVVFAGMKPTTGYKIQVTKVEDKGKTRSIEVAMVEPGQGCSTKSKKTSPYQFVSVPFSSEESLSHSDVAKKVDCK